MDALFTDLGGDSESVSNDIIRMAHQKMLIKKTRENEQNLLRELSMEFSTYEKNRYEGADKTEQSVACNK